MKAISKKLVLFLLVAGSIGFIQSCKNKEPSIIKVFVRNQGNLLVEGAQVVIVGDVASNPPTLPHVDTVFTNASGFAHFNMDTYYEGAIEEGKKDKDGPDYTVGYFDIIVIKDTNIVEGRIRSRAHTTAVETLYLPV